MPPTSKLLLLMMMMMMTARMRLLGLSFVEENQPDRSFMGNGNAHSNCSIDISTPMFLSWQGCRPANEGSLGFDHLAICGSVERSSGELLRGGQGLQRSMGDLSGHREGRSPMILAEKHGRPEWPQGGKVSHASLQEPWETFPPCGHSGLPRFWSLGLSLTT
jgi:hypothetical protein